MTNGGFDDGQDAQAEEVNRREFYESDHNARDSLANREAVALAGNEDLDADGKQKEHGRHQRFQEQANKVAVLLLLVVAACTFLGIAIYVWHLVAPICWRWLNEDDLDSIRTLLTGVLFSSAMSGYVNKRMSS